MNKTEPIDNSKGYKSYLLWLGIPVLLAFLLRLLVCICLQGSPAVHSPTPVTDMATYLRLAKEISQGQWPDHFDYQPFYYTIFLPIARFFGGDSPWAWMFPQILVGTGAVLFSALAALRLFGKKAALFTGLLLAFSQMHVFYTPFALYEVLQSFWMALILWLALLCAQSPHKIWLWSLTALLLGLATLTRGNALLLFPGFLLLFLWERRNLFKPVPSLLRQLLLLAVLILLFELPQLPYAIRNLHYTGRWCGASTAGEKVLCLGSNPEAPPGGLEYPPTYYKWVGEAERPAGEKRIPMTHNILNWMKKEPVLFLNLQWEKLLLFWHGEEIPNNVSLKYEDTRAPWLHFLLPFRILAPLALLGLFLGWKQPLARKAPPCAKTILYYTAIILWFSLVLFYILARFRLCTLPVLALFAAIGLLRLQNAWHIWREKRTFQSVQWTTLLLLLAIFLTNAAFPLWQENLEPPLHRHFRPNGTLIQTANSMILYDNGPIVYGGVRLYQNFSEQIQLTKIFQIPSGLSFKKTRVRLRTSPNGKGSILYNNQIIPARLRQELFGYSLEADLPFQGIPTQQTLKVTWHLSPGTTIGLDHNRNYNRTILTTIEGQHTPEAEAVCLLEFLP